MRITIRTGLVVAGILAAGCGGPSTSAPTPTPTPTPTPPPLPRVTAQVNPNPLIAQFKSVTTTTGTFEISATVTYRETAGIAGRITQIIGTIIRSPGGLSSGGSLDVSLPIGASGTATGTYTQQFDVTTDVDSVIWRFSASGVDGQGRAFTVSTIDVTVNPAPLPTPPPPPVSTTARLELWGGPNFSTFLGCWSCSEFAADSVFNQFGKYGSRYSSTSISNHFSQYGSQFGAYSACNEFTSTPPHLINTATNTYSELTLNAFRPFAITNSTIVNYLRRTICEL